MKKLNILFVIVFLFYACHDTSNTNQFVVTIDAVIKKTDSINIYYTEDNLINFDDNNSLWTKLEGDLKNQTIQIVLPEKIKPTQLRIDFGKNINNQEIVLNKICFTYLESSFEAKGEEIYWYFRPDENNTTLDKKNGVLKRKNPNQLNGPSIYPKGNKLKEHLNELYKKVENAK